MRIMHSPQLCLVAHELDAPSTCVEFGAHGSPESRSPKHEGIMCMCMYSETSDKGHSERGQTSQQRTHQMYSSIRLCTK